MWVQVRSHTSLVTSATYSLRTGSRHAFDVLSTCLRPARACHTSLWPGFRPARLMEFGFYQIQPTLADKHRGRSWAPSLLCNAPCSLKIIGVCVMSEHNWLFTGQIFPMEHRMTCRGVPMGCTMPQTTWRTNIPELYLFHLKFLPPRYISENHSCLSCFVIVDWVLGKAPAYPVYPGILAIKQRCVCVWFILLLLLLSFIMPKEAAREHIQKESNREKNKTSNLCMITYMHVIKHKYKHH